MAAPSKLRVLCLKFSPYPAYALKTRQAKIFVLGHDLSQRHRPGIFQIGIAHLQLEQHIIIPGFLVFFQDGFDLALHGFQIFHWIPP